MFEFKPSPGLLLIAKSKGSSYHTPEGSKLIKMEDKFIQQDRIRFNKEKRENK